MVGLTVVVASMVPSQGLRTRAPHRRPLRRNQCYPGDQSTSLPVTSSPTISPCNSPPQTWPASTCCSSPSWRPEARPGVVVVKLPQHWWWCCWLLLLLLCWSGGDCQRWSHSGPCSHQPVRASWQWSSPVQSSLVDVKYSSLQHSETGRWGGSQPSDVVTTNNTPDISRHSPQFCPWIPRGPAMTVWLTYANIWRSQYNAMKQIMPNTTMSTTTVNCSLR